MAWLYVVGSHPASQLLTLTLDTSCFRLSKANNRTQAIQAGRGEVLGWCWSGMHRAKSNCPCSDRIRISDRITIATFELDWWAKHHGSLLSGSFVASMPKYAVRARMYTQIRSRNSTCTTTSYTKYTNTVYLAAPNMTWCSLEMCHQLPRRHQKDQTYLYQWHYLVG